MHNTPSLPQLPSDSPSVLALFGASSRTGVLVTEKALASGNRVRAMLRPHSHWRFPESKRLTLSQGRLSDPLSVRAMIQGADAVCCLFGPRSPFSAIFCAEATRLIVDTMREEGVKRLICVTGALVGDYAGNRAFFCERLARAYARRRTWQAKDREEQEQLVKECGLDWTLIKPPRLTDGPTSEKLRCNADVRIGVFSHVSRTDLATCILKEIREPLHMHNSVFLSA